MRDPQIFFRRTGETTGVDSQDNEKLTRINMVMEIYFLAAVA